MTPEQIALVEGPESLVSLCLHLRRMSDGQGDQIDADRLSRCADLIEAQAAELATLRAERDALPRLTQGMIEAACIAHYGKKRVGLCGNADGVSMTVDDTDYNFTEAFRRMWSGVRAHLRALIAQEEGA